MAKIVLRQEAIDDLNNIWEYTFEKWSESQADKYYSMLKLSCKEIGKNPEIGKEYDEINKNLFGLHSGRHIIFYQFIDKFEIVKFVSDGPNGKITKIVLYQPMNEPDLYNLALGDLDSKTGEIDFDIRTNNGDRDMILATITETVYAFLYSRPTYSIHFKGSDSVSTRLYQMAISNYFDKLSEDFEIQGKLKNELLRFKKGVNFDAFIIQLKNK